MAAIMNRLIKRQVDQLFAKLNAAYGQCCTNPVTRGGFVWGMDPIAEQKERATIALLARQWFAVNGPPDAPPLPLNADDRDRFRNSGGITALVGFYARSLCRHGYDVCKHPSFYDFACGLMALAKERGLWGLERDETLMRRFPPRPLVGMMPAAYWHPREYAELHGRKAA